MNTYMHDALRISADERDAMREKIRLANDEARAHWFDAGWRGDMLKDLTETIFEGFTHENLLNLYSTVENADEFERITIEEVRGLEVFWVSLGGQIDQSRLTENVWEMRKDYVGFHVSELEDKMRSGFARSQANIIDLAIRQMDGNINSKLFTTLKAAVPDDGSSDYYVEVNGIDKYVVRQAITDVSEETLDDEVSIVGRRRIIDAFMDQLEDDNLYAPESNERLRALGVLGQYKGANIIRLKNYRDMYNRSFFPGNELWVVGRDASKSGFWGGMRSWEWSEQGGFYWHHMARREAGFAVHHRERVRRIKDIALPA